MWALQEQRSFVRRERRWRERSTEEARRGPPHRPLHVVDDVVGVQVHRDGGVAVPQEPRDLRHGQAAGEERVATKWRSAWRR